MKGRTIVLDHFGDIEAAALIVDGKLDDLLIDSEGPRQRHTLALATGQLRRKAGLKSG